MQGQEHFNILHTMKMDINIIDACSLVRCFDKREMALCALATHKDVPSERGYECNITVEAAFLNPSVKQISVVRY